MLYILYMYRGDGMQIIISNNGEVPIYQQIENNIKDMILSGDLTGGELLPSIRSLARDLKISVITTKRAYEELEKDGYIEIIPGKGCFVKNQSSEYLKEEVLKKMEDHLCCAVHIAVQHSIPKEEMLEILHYLYEEEPNEP